MQNIFFWHNAVSTSVMKRMELLIYFLFNLTCLYVIEITNVESSVCLSYDDGYVVNGSTAMVALWVPLLYCLEYIYRFQIVVFLTCYLVCGITYVQVLYGVRCRDSITTSRKVVGSKVNTHTLILTYIWKIESTNSYSEYINMYYIALEVRINIHSKWD